MTTYNGYASNYSVNKTVQFRVLSENQCEQIVQAGLEILERTGIEVYHKEALHLLKKAGCRVNDQRVRIPSYLIKKAISSAPSRIVLSDRYGNRRLFLEGYNSYFGPGLTNPYFIDVETGERRPTVKQDVINVARVADALPNVDFVMSLAGETDCPPEIADVHDIHAMLQNTTKPIVGWSTGVESCNDIMDMCAAVAGGLEQLQANPFLLMYAGNPICPLIHPEDSLDKLLFLVEKGIPVAYPTGMQPGSTSPATLAGSLAVGMADNLAGLLITQLKKEGAPYLGSDIILTMDMRTTSTCYGTPEFCLGHAAAADLHHYLGIPTWSIAGATDSKVVDQQAAIEATITIMSNALSGANLMHDLGFMESAMVGSLEQLVLGDEIIGMVRRIVSGIEVNTDTLAVDVVDRVGPGGHFLDQEHTMAHFKKESWFPTLMDRRRHAEWKMDGEKTMGTRLNERVKELLQKSQPAPLPEDTVRKLDQILIRAQSRVSRK